MVARHRAGPAKAARCVGIMEKRKKKEALLFLLSFQIGVTQLELFHCEEAKSAKSFLFFFALFVSSRFNYATLIR
jgi:hypothetical protein